MLTTNAAPLSADAINKALREFKIEATTEQIAFGSTIHVAASSRLE